MFRTITGPSPGASSHKLYKALQASLAVVWMYIHTAARLACTNVPMRYTVYEMMLLDVALQQLDSPARTYQCVIQFMR